MAVEMRPNAPAESAELAPVTRGTFDDFNALLKKYNCFALSITEAGTGKELLIDRETACEIGGTCVTLDAFDDRPNIGIYEHTAHITEGDMEVTERTLIDAPKINPMDLEESEPDAEAVIAEARLIMNNAETITVIAYTAEEHEYWTSQGSSRLEMFRKLVTTHSLPYFHHLKDPVVQNQ